MSLILRTATKINGEDATGGTGARGSVPPAPQPNPTVFATPGVHAWGVPPGVTSVTVEQVGAGGMGAAGTASSAGAGGGGGCYAKYTLGGALIVSGGVITVLVGAGGSDPTAYAGDTYCLSNMGTAKVYSKGARGAGAGGLGGSNTVTTGAGLVVITTTTGPAGGASDAGIGGAGGTAVNGGAGGAGGAVGKAGSPGVAPGGGGGGGGQDPANLTGGVGAPGRVVISH